MNQKGMALASWTSAQYGQPFQLKFRLPDAAHSMVAAYNSRGTVPFPPGGAGGLAKVAGSAGRRLADITKVASSEARGPNKVCPSCTCAFVHACSSTSAA